MLIALPLATAAVIALVWRHAGGPETRRAIALVAVFAFGIRLLAVLIVSIVAHQSHGTGVWLNDEASFFLATESLLPDPLDRTLPSGLDHLAGDGYLGLTTLLAMAGGVADANTFRVINASLGTLVVVLSMLMATRLFGRRAGLATGLLTAAWPTLVLWSATMLRDTLGSLAVVAIWWTLGRARELGWIRIACTLVLSVIIALSIRPYLGCAILIGFAVWAGYPLLRRQAFSTLAVASACVLAGIVVTAVIQARQLDFAMHELFYRQTVSRLETQGRLYSEDTPTSSAQPIRPGVIVAIRDGQTGWLLSGVVQQIDDADTVRIAFTDETIRDTPTRDVMLIQSAPISPLQLLSNLAPDVFDYLVGLSATSEPSSPAWIAMALAWDAILLCAALAVAVFRLSARVWLFPACVVAATVVALVGVPGAPGNADRHRATQTVPLLLVFASGLIWSDTGIKIRSARSMSAIRRAVTQVPLTADG